MPGRNPFLIRSNYKRELEVFESYSNEKRRNPFLIRSNYKTDYWNNNDIISLKKSRNPFLIRSNYKTEVTKELEKEKEVVAIPS